MRTDRVMMCRIWIIATAKEVSLNQDTMPLLGLIIPLIIRSEKEVAQLIIYRHQAITPTAISLSSRMLVIDQVLQQTRIKRVWVQLLSHKGYSYLTEVKAQNIATIQALLWVITILEMVSFFNPLPITRIIREIVRRGTNLQKCNLMVDSHPSKRTRRNMLNNLHMISTEKVEIITVIIISILSCTNTKEKTTSKTIITNSTRHRRSIQVQGLIYNTNRSNQQDKQRMSSSKA